MPKPPKSNLQPKLLGKLPSTGLLLLLLLSGCATPQMQPPPAPVRNVQIPPLPVEARQPTTLPECSPSCLEWLTTLREDWRKLLTKAAQQD